MTPALFLARRAPKTPCGRDYVEQVPRARARHALPETSQQWRRRISRRLRTRKFQGKAATTATFSEPGEYVLHG